MTQHDEPQDADGARDDQPVAGDPVKGGAVEGGAASDEAVPAEAPMRSGGPDPLVARLVDLVLIVGLAALVLGGLYFKLVLGNSWGITIARTVVTVVAASALTALLVSIRMARRRR